MKGDSHEFSDDLGLNPEGTGERTFLGYAGKFHTMIPRETLLDLIERDPEDCLPEGQDPTEARAIIEASPLLFFPSDACDKRNPDLSCAGHMEEVWQEIDGSVPAFEGYGPVK